MIRWTAPRPLGYWKDSLKFEVYLRFELSLFFVVQFQVRVLVGLKTSSPAFFRFLFFFRISSLLDVTEMTYIKEQEVAE
jgi:hypothetical protein